MCGYMKKIIIILCTILSIACIYNIIKDSKRIGISTDTLNLLAQNDSASKTVLLSLIHICSKN